MKRSQITTHVLNTSVGKPGENISVRVLEPANDSWIEIAKSVTDADGRVTDLFDANHILKAGTYKIEFDTGSYFASQHIKTFYPKVEIQFAVIDDSHYHVPLLINPFGYSTYRGS